LASDLGAVLTAVSDASPVGNGMPKQVQEPRRQQSSANKEGATTMKKSSNAAQQLIGSFAPKLVELTDRVLFDDVWERPELTRRDRSLITVSALIALNRPDQLRFHLGKAVENGVKELELIEAITHLAFYAGWPNAMSAIMLAKEVFAHSTESE
jgi:4-carboxymuconolactone decarboxylase